MHETLHSEEPNLRSSFTELQEVPIEQRERDQVALWHVAKVQSKDSKLDGKDVWARPVRQPV